LFLLLIVIALSGLGLTAVSGVWRHEAQREREAELLFAGREFRNAFAAYNQAHGGTAEAFPRQLEDLLEDRSGPAPRRFLRRVYADPMSGKADWGLVRTPGGGIRGVYSRSEAAPVRQVLPADLELAEGAAMYSEWKFAALPAGAAAALGTAPPDAVSPVITDASAEAPATPPQPQVAPLDPRLRRCAMIINIDKGACGALERRYGVRASVPCFRSAEARSTACEAGEAIPALVTNQR
jgi:type II secretory pathway pseudopilin PulG